MSLRNAMKSRKVRDDHIMHEKIIGPKNPQLPQMTLQSSVVI